MNIFPGLCYVGKKLRKLGNLLFDTFHCVKYFPLFKRLVACYFCVDCYTCPNDLKFCQ